MRFSANRAQSMRDMLDGKPAVKAKAKEAEALTFKAGPSLSEIFLKAAGLAGTHKTKDVPLGATTWQEADAAAVAERIAALARDFAELTVNAAATDPANAGNAARELADGFEARMQALKSKARGELSKAFFRGLGL